MVPLVLALSLSVALGQDGGGEDDEEAARLLHILEEETGVATKTRLNRVLLLGIGEPEKLDALAIESLGGTIYAHTAKLSGPVYLTVGPVAESKLDGPTRAAHLALGVKLRAYRRGF